MIISFHSNTMTFRGSENALWDYANFNESVLGNRSVICHRVGSGEANNPVYAKWKERFPLVSYCSIKELSYQLRNLRADILYQIKPGPFDHFIVPGLPNCIHAMFLTDEFHGDRFAFVSSWASRAMTGQEDSFVPHFVPRLQAKQNLRSRLEIPGSATVFGRHGATDTFNIPFVQRVVVEHARKHPDDHFCFLNTREIPGTKHLRNVHYLPGTSCPDEKASFLATCDAMLHARWHGETFGLAVGEFAVLGKPVITYGGSRERAHLDMLGGKAQVYENEQQLRRILEIFEPDLVWGTVYEKWSDPHVVMRIFQKRFLEETA